MKHQKDLSIKKSKKSISNEKCPLCKGTTWIFSKNEQGISVCEPCSCRTKEILNNKFKFAEMPTQLRELKLNSFNTGIYYSQKNIGVATQAKKVAINYVKNFETIKEKHTGLFFYSYTKGSGKTRLAVGIGNALISQYQSRVKFCTTTRLLEEIKATFGEKKGLTTSKYLEAVKNVEVLILDDIGTERLNSWVNEIFYEIINQRMLNKLITIYTSNCTIQELKHDDRIKSRIQGTVYPVQCPEEDIRCKIKGEENKMLEDILLA